MSKFLKTGFRELNFSLQDEAIAELRSMWQEHMTNISPYPQGVFEGYGIVLCAGGLSYFTCAWVCIHNLRAIGCTLPIEVWYLGEELNQETIHELEKLGVVCRNFLDYEHPTTLSGVSLKPLAILKSRFKHVLFLDADNNCLKDPEYLFKTKEYLELGAIFWPDFWKTDSQNPIWKIVDSQTYDMYEQESGQLVINKEKCWAPLNLTLYFNENKEYYYNLLFGDKDTFKFAWQALKQGFHMIETPVSCCGYSGDNGFLGITMVQHDCDGNALFLHRNLLKWDVTQENETRLWQQIKGFKRNAKRQEYYMGYNAHYRHQFIHINGDTVIHDTSLEIMELENRCLSLLRNLRSRTFYHRMLVEYHISIKRIR